jgi:hypothetical protein
MATIDSLKSLLIELQPVAKIVQRGESTFPKKSESRLLRFLPGVINREQFRFQLTPHLLRGCALGPVDDWL